MIIVKIQGGLGNQMFQYAFARKIQQETSRKIILDISDYKYDELRTYTLNKFMLNKNIEIDKSGIYNSKYDRRKNFFIKFMYKFAPEISFEFFSSYGKYIWDYIKYKEVKINSNKDTLFLHGYWQSIKYFDEIKDCLKRELRLKDEFNNKSDNLYNEINIVNSVCVHIRRGDFLLSTNKLCICSNEYFLRAMKEVKKYIENPIFYIFSDDIEEVKTSFNFEEFNVVFVKGQRTDYQELELMYSCKHFIISNSTFSWWGQYLSNNKDKIVIAPSRWYIDDRPNELLDESWIIFEP